MMSKRANIVLVPDSKQNFVNFSILQFTVLHGDIVGFFFFNSNSKSFSLLKKKNWKCFVLLEIISLFYDLVKSTQ